MFIKIIKKSTDFPNYFFNDFVGSICEIGYKGKTFTKGVVSKKKQHCFWVKTGLSEIPFISVPVENAIETHENNNVDNLTIKIVALQQAFK